MDIDYDDILKKKISYVETIVGPITERERSLLWLFHNWTLDYHPGRLPMEIVRRDTIGVYKRRRT